jgi:hypothetical protein
MFLGACDFTGPGPAAPPEDAALPDVEMDACTSFAVELSTCSLPGQFPLILDGSLVFNTDTGMLQKITGGPEIPVNSAVLMTRGAEVRALVASTAVLQPGATLHPVGTRGFALVASGSIRLEAGARIDAGAGGAGYRSDCGTGKPGAGADDTDGGAGGGGGGLGAAGGAGGNGNADHGPSIGGTAGAAAASIDGPTGGCQGGHGGHGDASNDGGAGGKGGGAVYLVSATSITITEDAGIDAGGGGGSGGGYVFLTNGDAGGGGGGSGGSIFLEAPLIRSAGILAANGGGGGEGSGAGAGRTGNRGPFDVTQAPGGDGNSGSGSPGGSGGFRGSPAGVAPTQILNGGGGGGGGGAGVIRVHSPDAQLGTKVSPDATMY